MKNSIIFIAILLSLSCSNEKKTGIEGNNNNNNSIVIADKIVMPDEESRRYKSNFDITTEGVAGIRLGQTIDEIQKFFKKNTNFLIKTDEGARGEGTDFAYPTIYALDSNETALFGVRYGNLKIATGIEIYSAKYLTYNGIHVGMPITELSALYGDDLVLKADELSELDYFQPFDLSGSKSFIQIYVQSNDNKSLWLNDALENAPHNYRKEGKVAFILVTSSEMSMEQTSQ